MTEPLKIHSYNEWDKLRSIVVGTASNANWPSDDPVFAEEMADAPWKETPPPGGAVPQHIVDEANEDLQGLCDILLQAGVAVYRPKDMDFVDRGGMYNYCPRDRLLIAGDDVVDPAMMYPCRDMEIENLDFVTQWANVKTMPRDQGMVLDAANIARLGDTWLMLESASGNRAAYNWLRSQFPHINIELCNFYAGVHIDSTISPVNEDTVIVNAHRVKPSTLPKSILKKDIIWVNDCVPQSFYEYPYASKWIGINTLSIDPTTIIVDAAQTDLHKQLEKRGITVVPHTLRHSRTLGGGFHCVTLDLWRENV
jgi:scyllo-inosamine-4-phosphate amidinotransferase 1